MFSQYVCTSIWAGDEVQVLNTYDVSMYLYGRTQYKQYQSLCIQSANSTQQIKIFVKRFKS